LDDWRLKVSLDIIEKLRKQMSDAEAEVQKVRKEMRAQGRAAIEPVFKHFLEENPDIAAIRWEQYTPYFNDGEECHFRLRQFCLEFTDDFRSKHMNEDFDAQYAEEEKWYEGEAWYVSKESTYGQSVLAKFKAFENQIRDQSLFYAIFGDHVRVTATRNGLSVDDYNDHH
jgi:hypothetical protein